MARGLARRVPGRTLIYVGRDYDAAWAYWQKVEPTAPPSQRDEIRPPLDGGRSNFSSLVPPRNRSQDCEWFTVESKHRPRKVRTLEGDPDWLDGIDPPSWRSNCPAA